MLWTMRRKDIDYLRVHTPMAMAYGAVQVERCELAQHSPLKTSAPAGTPEEIAKGAEKAHWAVCLKIGEYG